MGRVATMVTVIRMKVDRILHFSSELLQPSVYKGRLCLSHLQRFPFRNFPSPGLPANQVSDQTPTQSLCFQRF